MAKSSPIAICFALVVSVLLGIGMGLVVDWWTDRNGSWDMCGNQRALSAFGEQVALQEQYADTLKTDIIKTLEPLVGVGAVRATVRAQMNLEKTDKTYHQNDQRGRANQIGSPVQKLSVNVVIDGQMIPDKTGVLVYQPRSKADMSKYTELVKMIVGFNADRGDKVKVESLPFTEHGRSERKWVNGDDMRGVGLGLSAVIILGLMGWFCCGIMGRNHRFCPRSKGSVLTRVTVACRQLPERAVIVIRSWLMTSQKRINPRTYSMAERAAIVVLSLDEGISAVLLNRLSDRDVQQLGQVMERLGTVSAAEIQDSLVLFLKQLYRPRSITGTPERVHDLFMKARPDGRRLYAAVRLTRNGQTVWDRVATLTPGQMKVLLDRQNTETIALILYHLSDSLSGQILMTLPRDISARVLIHLAHIRRIRPSVRDRLMTRVAGELEVILQEHDQNGSRKMDRILNTLSAAEQANLRQAVLPLSSEVAARMAVSTKTWADVCALADNQVQTLLAYLDPDVLAAALVGETADTQNIFIRHIPVALIKMWQQCQHKQPVMSPKQAQALILKTVQELHLWG